MNNEGLKHKDCLQILFNEIDDELVKYKQEKLIIRLIAKAFFKARCVGKNMFILNTDG